MSSNSKYARSAASPRPRNRTAMKGTCTLCVMSSRTMPDHAASAYLPPRRPPAARKLHHSRHVHESA
jgi:hypothetical protein